MRKSSIYLPDDLKDALSALSHRTGRSEAELIRTAIERLVRSADNEPATAVAAAVRPGPRLVGVGVGPSDPALVTERAVVTLRSADRVLAASTSPDAIGRAEAVVRAVAPDVGVDRLVIAIGGDDGERAASIDAAAEGLLAHLDRGELVAVVVLGDPNVYSVFPRMAARVAELRPGVDVETVPGVMAFQDLAAHTGTVLADTGEALSITTLGTDLGTVADLLDDPDRGVVIYKGGRLLPELAAVLTERKRLDGAVVGEMLGLPGGRSVPVAEAADRPASYLATIIVPPVRDGTPTDMISFVGAGPGAADLLTVRAVERLRAADVVIWAGSLVAPEVLDHCRAGVVRHDSAGLTLEEITALFDAHDGAAIVRLQSGDPSVYGAITEQIAWCIAHERDFEIVPGVSSLAAAAASIGRELTVPGLAQSVVLTRLAHRTAASVPDHESPSRFAALGPTMAVFLSAARPDALQAELLAVGSAYDDTTPAVICHRVSWPDERLVDTTVGSLAATLKELGATTTVLVLVGDALRRRDDPQRSHVYAGDYSHSFRGARP